MCCRTCMQRLKHNLLTCAFECLLHGLCVSLVRRHRRTGSHGTPFVPERPPTAVLGWYLSRRLLRRFFVRRK